MAAENTLSALQEASTRAIQIVETDIMMTRDGVPVCAHDYSLGLLPLACSTLSLTYLSVDTFTNGTGRIDEQDWADIQYTVVKRGSTSSDESSKSFDRLNTLDRLIIEAKRINLQLYIEIKTPRNRKQQSLLLNSIATLLEKHNFTDHCIVLSFFPNLLSQLKSIDPRIYTMFLYTSDGIQRWCKQGFNLDTLLWRALCYRPDLLHVLHRRGYTTANIGFCSDAVSKYFVSPIAKYFNVDSLGLALNAVTEENMRMFRLNGFQFIAAWTANTAEQKQQVISAGVNSIISDCPGGVQLTCPSDLEPL